MIRPGRRLPKAIVTVLRSHQSIPSKRTPFSRAPDVDEWDDEGETTVEEPEGS